MPMASYQALPHPLPLMQRADLGTLLVADVLVEYMFRSLLQYRVVESSTLQGGSGGTGLGSLPSAAVGTVGGGGDYLRVLPLPPPLHDEAKRMYRSRCYGVAFQQVWQTSVAHKGFLQGGRFHSIHGLHVHRTERVTKLRMLFR